MTPRTNERGSSLMLAPAGVLVLMALGAISVDSAIAFSAQRELSSQAIAAVNDAVTLSLTDSELQRGKQAHMDAAIAERVVRDRMAAVSFSGLHLASEDIIVQVDNQAGTVTVTAEGNADYIFSKAIPGARDNVQVRTTATAALTHRTAE